MLKNYLIVAWRNLRKHKVFSFVSIMGLALGVASFVLILQYVYFEMNYDNFHEHAERIYRVRNDHYVNGELSYKRATTYRDTGPSLAEDFPEVQAFARLNGTFGNSVVISCQQQGHSQQFFEENFFYADSSFLSMFSFPLIRGNATTALAQPSGAVITVSAAQKYFGKDDPIGKTVTIDGDKTYRITGILKDIPDNSHIQFDWLFSLQSLDDFKERRTKNWSGAGGDVAYTYILLHPETNPRWLEAKLPQFIEKYKSRQISSAAIHDRLLLQALQDIHLHSSLDLEAGENGSWVMVYFLGLIAGLVITIAWINYIILSIAKAMGRAKEVGVRKAMGAERKQLIKQFLLETSFLNVLACITALLLIGLFLPLITNFTYINLHFISLETPFIWILFLIVFLIGVFISGLYPAFFLSSFKSITATKGKLSATAGSSLLRKTLIIFQFTSAIVLISGTFGVYEQLNFMKNQNLGIDIDKTLVIRAPGVTDSTYFDRLSTFKNELSKINGIKGITASSEIPGKPFSATRMIFRETNEIEDARKYFSAWVDYDYLPSFGLQLLAGRNFSEDFGTDENNIIVNEELVKSLGLTNASEAIGQKVIAQGAGHCTIIGVVSNYHQQSLKDAHYAIAFFLNTWRSKKYYSLKLANNITDNAGTYLPGIKATWDEIFPGNPFDYFFLEDYFNKQYQSDRQFGQVFGLFSGFTIFIACLGLFGLAFFSTTQRTKEIGVRKILGASIGNMLVLLNKDFLKLIFIAIVLAWPITYLGIREWLQSYAFRVDISVWIFFIPSVLVFLIALMTISTQIWKSARTNPVDSLRFE